MEEYTWDLNKIYYGCTDPRISKDINSINKKVQILISYKEKLEILSSYHLKTYISLYESTLETLFKVKSYAVLLYLKTKNANVTSYYQNIIGYSIETEKNLQFIKEKIKNRKDYSVVLNSLKETHKLWLQDEKDYHFRTLPLISKKLISLYGKSYLSLYDLLLAEHIECKNIFSLILNTHHSVLNLVAKDLNLNNGLEFSCYENNFNPEILRIMSEKISLFYKEKFVKERKNLQLLNKKAVVHYSEKFTHEYSKEIILECLGEFSPTFKHIGKKFFSEKRIDYLYHKGKDPGALSYQTTPLIKPYILLNIKKENWLSDTSVTVHELGHGIHQTLSGQSGILNSYIPTVINEINSIFTELLLFDFLLKKDMAKEGFLASVYAFFIKRIEGLLFKQLSYHQFEENICKQEKLSPLSPEKVEEIWINTQKIFHENIDNSALKLLKKRWYTIPHFFKHPFYIYNYPLCFCIAVSLFLLYKEDSSKFTKIYISLLSTGSNLTIKLIEQKLGIHPQNANFYKNVTNFIEIILKSAQNAHAELML